MNCSLNSTATFSADLAEFNACMGEAWEGTCASFVAESEECYTALIGHGDPIDTCMWTTGSFDIYASQLITAICGPAELPRSPTHRRTRRR